MAFSSRPRFENILGHRKPVRRQQNSSQEAFPDAFSIAAEIIILSGVTIRKHKFVIKDKLVAVYEVDHRGVKLHPKSKAGCVPSHR